jgi:hypothetical protein
VGEDGQRLGGDEGAGDTDPDHRPGGWRNRRQPMCIPPSNRITASATVTTRWTLVTDT